MSEKFSKVAKLKSDLVQPNKDSSAKMPNFADICMVGSSFWLQCTIQRSLRLQQPTHHPDHMFSMFGNWCTKACLISNSITRIYVSISDRSVFVLLTIGPILTCA